MEMDNIKQHELLLRQIHDTYIKKNHDYGDSFSKSYKKYGLVAAMVLMGDKWNRLDNLAMGAEQNVSDEYIRDTLLDLAGYCIMTTMELDKQKSVENQKAFEEQVRTENVTDCNQKPFKHKISLTSMVEDMADKADDSVEDTEKVVLHDEESGDIEVNVPEKVAKEKKSIDEGKVMALYKAKWSQKKIADEMGCSQGRISQIIKVHKC